MDYNKIYNEIIERAVEREVEGTLEEGTYTGYTEKHHIKPKCMGGEDADENLVRLTAREHFICHFLLYKIHKSSKLAFAFNAMCMKGKSTEGRYTSHSFKYAKEAFAKAQSILQTGSGNTFYGKKHSEETRLKMAEVRKGRVHSEESKRKMSESAKCMSEETKRKMSIAATGKKASEETRRKLSAVAKVRQFSEETRRKISMSNTGKTHSEETRRKMSERQMGEKHHFFGRKTPEETKKKLAEANRGENNYRFTGYYITPHGTFSSTTVAAKITGIPHGTLFSYCKNPNHVVKRASKVFSKEDIGRTYKDLGFYFVKVKKEAA